MFYDTTPSHASARTKRTGKHERPRIRHERTQARARFSTPVPHLSKHPPQAGRYRTRLARRRAANQTRSASSKEPGLGEHDRPQPLLLANRPMPSKIAANSKPGSFAAPRFQVSFDAGRKPRLVARRPRKSQTRASLGHRRPNGNGPTASGRTHRAARPAGRAPCRLLRQPSR